MELYFSKLKIEKETEKYISSPDVLISKCEHGFISEVYIKITEGTSCIHATCNYSQQQKFNISCNFIHRGMNILLQKRQHKNKKNQTIGCTKRL